MNVASNANITMTFTNESLIGVVYQAMTSNGTSGLDHMLVDMLIKIYVPQDMVSNIDLCRALNSLSMKKEEYPANIFGAIGIIKNKYNMATCRFPYEEKIEIVLENVPTK